MTKEWDADMPLSDYAPGIQRVFREHAQYLLDDLKNNKNQHGKIPAREQSFEGHGEYITLQRNPQWYSELFRKFSYSLTRRRGNPNRVYTRIRGPKHTLAQRAYVKTALEKIIESEDRQVNGAYLSERTYGMGRKRYPHEKSKRKQGEKLRAGELYEKTERKKVKVRRYENQARVRQLIYERLTQGFIHEDGTPELPDRRVRQYFNVPLPSNHSEMIKKRKQKIPELERAPF